MWSSITLPLAPVLTLHLRLPCWFGSYFNRHGDRWPNVSECINVECSGVDVFWVSRGYVGHVDRGTIVTEWAFWATQGNNALGLAWSSPGFQPSETEWCGWTCLLWLCESCMFQASWLLWPWCQVWAISWPVHYLWGHGLDGIRCFIPFPHLLGSDIYWQGSSDDIPVHLGCLQAWFTHLQIGIFGIVETQYGPSDMLNDPGRILHSSW